MNVVIYIEVCCTYLYFVNKKRKKRENNRFVCAVIIALKIRKYKNGIEVTQIISTVKLCFFITNFTVAN
jgi:hypothetical protein